jgi:hypothetical protein
MKNKKVMTNLLVYIFLMLDPIIDSCQSLRLSQRSILIYLCSRIFLSNLFFFFCFLLVLELWSSVLNSHSFAQTSTLILFLLFYP